MLLEFVGDDDDAQQGRGAAALVGREGLAKRAVETLEHSLRDKEDDEIEQDFLKCLSWVRRCSCPEIDLGKGLELFVVLLITHSVV